MSTLIGVNSAATSATASFGVGDRHVDHDGNEWVYVLAGEAIAQYDFVAIDEDYGALKLTGTLALTGQAIGVAQVAFANADYGWVLTRGVGTGAVSVSTPADITLNTSATSGTLGFLTSVGSNIMGVVATAAQGGTSLSANTAVLVTTYMQPSTF